MPLCPAWRSPQEWRMDVSCDLHSCDAHSPAEPRQWVGLLSAQRQHWRWDVQHKVIEKGIWGPVAAGWTHGTSVPGTSLQKMACLSLSMLCLVTASWISGTCPLHRDCSSMPVSTGRGPYSQATEAATSLAQLALSLCRQRHEELGVHARKQRPADHTDRP